MHNSTAFHLHTEAALLATLYTRSKAQHRSQVFLRHLQHVVRLAKAVSASLAANAAPGLPVSASSTPAPVPSARVSASAPPSARASPSPALVPPKPAPATTALVQKLIPALVLAANATRRMLELHHFVPLQTLLMAAYARLLAVSMHIASDLGLDVTGPAVLSGNAPRKAAYVPVTKLVDVTALALVDAAGGGGGDIGERIERKPAAAAGLSAPKTVNTNTTKAKATKSAPASSALSKAATPVPVPDGTPPEAERVPTPKRKRGDADVPAKKKRAGAGTDDLDDMFAGVTEGASAKKGKKSSKRDELNDIFAAGSADKKEKKEKKEKKKDAKDELDDIFGAAAEDEPKPKPKPKAKAKAKKSGASSSGTGTKEKKKKKDAMDDIFGF